MNINLRRSYSMSPWTCSDSLQLRTEMYVKLFFPSVINRNQLQELFRNRAVMEQIITYGSSMARYSNLNRICPVDLHTI